MIRFVRRTYPNVFASMKLVNSLSNFKNKNHHCLGVQTLTETSRGIAGSARFYSETINDTDEPIFDMTNPYEKEQIQCILCKHNIVPDYKNVRLLSQFQSPYTGRIYGRHITGLCKKQQELVEKEIIKAQNAGLMATYIKEPVFLRDPELFDVEKPLRPHKF